MRPTRIRLLWTPQSIVAVSTWEVYQGCTWESGKVSQLLPMLASMHRGASASRFFWSELAAHFAHRVFIYPGCMAELFSENSQQLCPVGKLFGVIPPRGLRPAEEPRKGVVGMDPFLRRL